MNPRAPNPPGDTPSPRRVSTASSIVICCLIILAMVALAVIANRWFAARFGNGPTTTEEWLEPLPRQGPADLTGPEGAVVQPPLWARQPIPEYPEQAMRQGIEGGVAELRCVTQASGEIGSCQVLSEDPAGAGFGQAAVRGVRDARVTPRTVNGQAAPGTIQFKVRFQLAE